MLITTEMVKRANILGIRIENLKTERKSILTTRTELSKLQKTIDKDTAERQTIFNELMKGYEAHRIGGIIFWGKNVIPRSPIEVRGNKAVDSSGNVWRRTFGCMFHYSHTNRFCLPQKTFRRARIFGW